MKTSPLRAALLLALSVSATACLGAAPAPARAQSAPPVLHELDPGRVSTPDAAGIRRMPNSLPGSLDASDYVLTQPAVNDGAPVESTQAALPFTVDQVQLLGVTRYPQDAFDDLTAGLVGHPVTLDDVGRVTRQVTARYRADGYLLVRTYVPAQSLDRRVLTLQVMEGRLDQVKIEGHGSRAMERYLENLRSEQPLTEATLERNLLLINDLPGNQASAVMAPAGSGAGTDMYVKNEEFRRWDGFLGLDNRSSRYYGPWQAYGGVNLNDATGIGDRLSLRGGTSLEGDQLRFYEAQYEAPVGSNGGMLSLLAQHNDGRADLPSYLNANSQGDTLAMRYAYPLIRSREQTLKISAAFTWFNGNSEYLDDPSLPPSTDDRIRAIRLGTSWDFTDTHGGRNLFKGELSQGLDVMGASKQGRVNASREGGRTDFTKLQLDAQRVQNLSWITPDLELYLAATGQTSFGEPLLSPEQFGVGGNTFGRGYDPSEIAGDSGIAGKVELRYSVRPEVGGYAVPTQFYTYLDAGRVWNAAPYYVRTESLVSAGFGAHLSIAKDMYLTPEIAFPLTRSVAAEEYRGRNGNAPRYYLNFIKLF